MTFQTEKTLHSKLRKWEGGAGPSFMNTEKLKNSVTREEIIRQVVEGPIPKMTVISNPF